VYVDDILLTGNNVVEINHIADLLHAAFRIKNLGNLAYFLGFEVARNSTGLHLNQRKYTLDLLHDIGMLDSFPAPTPMAQTSCLQHIGQLLDPDEASSYRRLIGRLIYLTNMRPDISFSVNNLSQFVAAPTPSHKQAVFRVLRYLKNSLGNGLFFPINTPIELKAYSDSDWATCPETRKSITRFSIYLGQSLISWKSKNSKPYHEAPLKLNNVL